MDISSVVLIIASSVATLAVVGITTKDVLDAHREEKRKSTGTAGNHE